MLKRIGIILTGALLMAAPKAQAQENWPDFFDGVNSMGPYAWLSPADAQARGLTLDNAVKGGQEAGGQALALCRAALPDGVHPGKLHAGNCNIGWGGQEVVKSSGFEVLYQTQPSLAKYLPQEWVDPGIANDLMTFKGGQAGSTQIRVARVNYEGGVHPGKEWAGKCYIGYGGQEKAVNPPYQVLILKFDKTAWRVAQPSGPAPIVTPITSPGPAPSPDPNTWPATFDGISSLGPYAWMDGPAALQSDPQLANAVYGGQVGNTRQAVCRAQFQDGVHPGKYFNGQCNIGWGGKEVALTKDYQVLVNAQPQQAKYLTQRWNAVGEGFVGGAVGDTPLRVCQTWAADGTHLGKVWQGRCYYSWGGEERSDINYGMLFLEFDKAAWQAANQNLLINQTTVTLQPVNTQDMQVTIQTGPINTAPLDPSVLQQLNVEPIPVVVGVNWAPGSLGNGFDYVATYLPQLTYKMIDHYNATCTDPALRRNRDEMYAAVKQGEVKAQAAMVLVMAEFAESILNRNADSLTTEEKSYAKFLVALANDQRQRAGQEGLKNFKQWEYEEIGKRTSEGLIATIDPLVNPPPEILAMAKAGYAVTPQTVDNYFQVLAACSAPIAAGVGWGTAGLIVAIPGGTAAFATVFVPSVKIGMDLVEKAGGSVIARALPMLAGAGGGIAVATLMIQAAIMKGIDVVKYEEYKTALNQAVAASQVPLTQEQLRLLLNTEEGMKTLGSWLTAQAATGTAY